MASNDNWGQLWTLAKLDFAIHGTTDNQVAKIYANSRNMVETIITVEILDKNGKSLNVTDDEVKAKLYFCQSETGEDLDSLWLISDKPNEYVNGTSSPKSTDSGSIRHIRKYISCTKHNRDEITEKISVGINIPGFKKFDTSRDGTSSKTGSGGVYKSPKAFAITALRPIDYGLHANISIECSEFETVDNSLNYVDRIAHSATSSWGMQGHNDGKCRRRTVYIRPNKKETGEEKFQKHEILYDTIKNSDVSTGTSNWTDPFDKSYTNDPGFSLVREGSEYGSLGAVIGRGANRDDFEANLWFACQKRVAMNGRFYIIDGDGSKTDGVYQYCFKLNDKAIEKNYSDEEENGAATLVLYKMILPKNNATQLNWHNVIRDITVNVIDFNGNDGSFKLLLNDNDRFDEPVVKL